MFFIKLFIYVYIYICIYICIISKQNNTSKYTYISTILLTLLVYV